jgi:hypothetical protein
MPIPSNTKCYFISMESLPNLINRSFSYFLRECKRVDLKHVQCDLNSSIELRVLLIFKKDIEDIKDDFPNIVFEAFVWSFVFLHLLLSSTTSLGVICRNRFGRFGRLILFSRRVSASSGTFCVVSCLFHDLNYLLID